MRLGDVIFCCGLFGMTGYGMGYMHGLVMHITKTNDKLEQRILKLQ